MTQLYFAAKAPRPGEVKTRLAPALGCEGAAQLYRAFLADLSARFAGTGLDTGWFVPSGAWEELQPLVAPDRQPRVRLQQGWDWGERQQNLFREAEADSELPLVLVGTDSPQIEPWLVEAALARLEDADVVFGPTLDGGYYLVAMRRCHEVLIGVPMSTGRALFDVTGRARALGLEVALLPPTFDVDEPSDLGILATEAAARPDLLHTSQALKELRVTVDV